MIRFSRPGRACARRGLTLLEVMMASGIAMIISGISMRTLVYIEKSAVRISLINEMAKETRYLADVMASDVRSAVGFEASFSSYTAGADTIILKIPSIDGNEDIIDIDSTFDRIVYHPGSGGGTSLLMREVLPDASSARSASSREIGSLLSSESYNGAFASQPNALGAHVLHYQFESSRDVLGKTIKVPVSGSVRLRNKP